MGSLSGSPYFGKVPFPSRFEDLLYVQLTVHHVTVLVGLKPGTPLKGRPQVANEGQVLSAIVVRTGIFF